VSLELQVGEADAGSRLDLLLVRRVDGMSRAKARRLIDGGSVRVNGRRVKKGARLSAGDRVSLTEMPAPTDFPALPAESLSLTVHYEDRHLVVVEKPAGLPCHPLRSDEDETLAGALMIRYPEMAGVGYALREPGILHRLDNDTSGLLLAARSARAFDALHELLASGAIDKRYEALAFGTVEPCIIDAPIASHPSDPRRVHACVHEADRRRSDARPARTEVLRAEPVAGFTLIEVKAPLAVRHQIRAHLAAIDHPLAGDWLYGGPSIPGLERHFLHASRMTFDHPLEETRLDLHSPLPAELVRVLDELKQAS
jgi:23S rRNA pseudouridine1911/1915/1917 synthase